ncbi:MAG: hypothetical protein ACYC5K_02340, partial [Saccharofermentanales bacterium]
MKPSPYPIYDKPLEMEGDAVVIPDPEFPYHEAEFMNRVLDLADAWKIKQCNIAGDAMHFNAISKFEPAWKEKPKNTIDEKMEAELLEIANDANKRTRERLLEVITRNPSEQDGDDVGNEVETAKRALIRLGEQFDRVDYVIGNHDGRFLSALNSPTFADQLLKFIGLNEPKWRIAPYYYSFIRSGGELFRIEHPKSASQSTASKLASKYLCHVLMGHSHLLSSQFDQSGSFWAMHMGHCVDERRLPYASQRSNTSPAHVLGAVIIRDGFPHLQTDVTG